MTVYGNLSIWNLICFENRSDELPSWVVDFSGLQDNVVGDHGQSLPETIKSAGVATSRPQMLDSRNISIEGVYFDRVAAVDDVYILGLGYYIDPEPSARHANFLKALYTMFEQPCEHPSPLSLFADSRMGIQSIPKVIWEGGTLREPNEILGNNLYKGFCELWRELVGFLESGICASVQHDEYFQCVSCGRRVSITERGFVGAGIGQIAEGDVIVKLDGANSPVALRAEADGDRYSFRGFVDVHGFFVEVDEDVDESHGLPVGAYELSELQGERDRSKVTSFVLVQCDHTGTFRPWFGTATDKSWLMDDWLMDFDLHDH